LHEELGQGEAAMERVAIRPWRLYSGVVGSDNGVLVSIDRG
jgi:hypothetical protein